MEMVLRIKLAEKAKQEKHVHHGHIRKRHAQSGCKPLAALRAVVLNPQLNRCSSGFAATLPERP